MDIYKFKQAIVNLECIADSVPSEVLHEESREAYRKLSAGVIDEFEYGRILDSTRGNDNRGTGTAVYIVHGSLHYLITARHVIVNDVELEYQLEQLEQAERATPIRFPGDTDYYARSRKDIERYTIRRYITIVPTYKARKDKGFRADFPSMMLGNGTYAGRSYLMSDEATDLALICLDDQIEGLYLIQFLDANGYKAIDYADILQDDIELDAEIAALGYPADVSTLGQMQHSSSWASSYFSEPTVTFGRLLEIDARKYYAIANVIEGHSGGAFVYQDKLAGIVIERLTKEYDAGIYSDLPVWIKFAIATKSKYILDLIAEFEPIREEYQASIPQWAKDFVQEFGSGRH